MIRALTTNDIEAAKIVIDEVGLFPSEMLGDMAGPALDSGTADELWLVDDCESVAGLLDCAPERMTSGTWNNLLLAVRPHLYGQGIGAGLLQHMEELLRGRDCRIPLVETSGLPEFERTRRFYRHVGYEREGCIRDFYDAGEDKVIFRKAL